MRPSPLTIAEVEYVAFKLAEELMMWDEPIPAFGTRFPNILESCLLTPFSKYSKKDLYRGLFGKSSILFYLLIKNHPFANGNKRIAVMTLLYFLYKNGKWFKVTNEELYKFARWVAKSASRKKEVVTLRIREFIQANLVDYSHLPH